MHIQHRSTLRSRSDAGDSDGDGGVPAAESITSLFVVFRSLQVYAATCLEPSRQLLVLSLQPSASPASWCWCALMAPLCRCLYSTTSRLPPCRSVMRRSLRPPPIGASLRITPPALTANRPQSSRSTCKHARGKGRAPAAAAGQHTPQDHWLPPGGKTAACRSGGLACDCSSCMARPAALEGGALKPPHAVFWPFSLMEATPGCTGLAMCMLQWLLLH